MRVILLKDVPGLGKRGDIKDVSDGYGRNFLLRNKLVEIMTPQLKNKLEALKAGEEKAVAALKEKSLALKEKIEKIKFAIKTKIGESGQVFGSVTPHKISEELNKKGINVPKEQIMAEPIKTLGEHKVKIKLPQGIEAVLPVIIESEPIKKR